MVIAPRNIVQPANVGQDPTCPSLLRVLNDPPCRGIVNMARDEALLILVDGAAVPATLRFYAWSEPTISLGYFQRFADYQALPPPAGDMPVVRRMTGGGAILHDRELTYSLTLPADHAAVAGRPNRLYELAHQALMSSLSEAGVEAHRCDRTDGSGPRRGPFFCFARRHRFDVMIGSQKVAGSAQRRTRQAILQHGSIIVERRYDQQPAADLGSIGICVDTLRRCLPQVLSDLLGAQPRDNSWTKQELELAYSLESKYAGQDWTRRR